MRRGFEFAALMASTALATTALFAAPAMAAGYKFDKVATIELQGQKGHGDIVTYDRSNNMVYVSMPQGLDVIDTKTNKVTHFIQDVPSPNGNDYDAHFVYVAAGDGAGQGKVNAIVVIDKKTWKEVGRVDTKGTSPDWLAVDRRGHVIYTDSDDANHTEVYKAGAKPALEHVWALYPANAKSGPDVAALVDKTHTIYQSDDSYVLKVNAKTGAIEAKTDTGVPLAKNGGTKGEVYDAKTQTVWAGTTGKTMVVLDANTLAIKAKLPQTGGADQVAIDPALGLVYAFEGGAKGFDVYDAKTMKHLAFVSTGIGNTHTGDVDTRTHAVYAYAGDGGVVDVFKPVKE